MKSKFTKHIISSYNNKSRSLTGKRIALKDKQKVFEAETIVSKYPAIYWPICTGFNDGLSSIKCEKYQAGRDTKWTTIVQRLVVKPAEEYQMLKDIYGDSMPDGVIERIIDFHMAVFTKRANKRPSHPFIVGKGEVDKARELLKTLHHETFKAREGFLISCGGLVGYLGRHRKELNTKVFIDYCKSTGVNKITVNTIDKPQLDQVIEYGEINGLTIAPVLEDGLKCKFATDQPAIVVVDGYGKFQTAEYINSLKETIPNSIFIVTVAKAKYRKDVIIDFSKQVNYFIDKCNYRCYKVPYGRQEEETMMVVKEPLDKLDKIMCRSFV